MDRGEGIRVTDGVELSIRQFREAWRVICLRTPGHAVASQDGIEYIFSGLPIAFFNVAILTGRDLTGDGLKAHGDAACRWVTGKDVPWMFVVTQEALQSAVDATSVLADCGLVPVMPLTGMFAQRVASTARVPAGLQLGVPQDDAGCEALLNVNSAAYEIDLAAAKPAIGTRSFWRDHVPALGRVDRLPVSCAAVLVVDGHRYVAFVATDPGHQRRGYGEASMRHALEVAAREHGELPTVLHATDAGLPIYQRMGYSTIATHSLFMEERFLTEH